MEFSPQNMLNNHHLKGTPVTWQTGGLMIPNNYAKKTDSSFKTERFYVSWHNIEESGAPSSNPSCLDHFLTDTLYIQSTCYRDAYSAHQTGHLGLVHLLSFTLVLQASFLQVTYIFQFSFQNTTLTLTFIHGTQQHT